MFPELKYLEGLENGGIQQEVTSSLKTQIDLGS